MDCCQATIWKKLKEFNIIPRVAGPKRVNLTKDQLKGLYLDKKLSTWQIEKKLKIPRGTIHRKLKEFDIETRDRSDSHIIYQRKDFSGDLVEKAYIIGFRIGDLGVRKIYPNSKTICVASGSTIREQIDLMESMFKNYGNVWIKTSKNGKINLQVALNDSFKFLLTKEVPSWIFKNKKHFFSFFAGFIDAEGHIGVYKETARFSLGNYDSGLLIKIHNQLKKYRIHCREPYSDNRKGKLNSQGYPYRENYWNLRIHRKDELSKLFKEIKPHIKHPNKVKALNNAILNIECRNMKHGKK